MTSRRIIQLDEETIGHISAGEVVERPAQVVKELIENSIDAHSTRISVHIQNGGFASIEVIDNGDGIFEDDIALAFNRHATSKLSQFEDLAKIFSLGFRGEALASIGIVSSMTLSSKRDGEDGATISMEYGQLGSVESKGMAKGTIVTVRDLFSNTPARLSFQKRPQTEVAKIIDAVVGHALAHEHISFQLESDGRTLLNIPKNEDKFDRLYDILGSQANEMVSLRTPQEDTHIPGNEQWTGFISTPEITRGKGDEIHILINNRPVAATPFLSSIRKGYKTRLMQGRHPIAVLNLTCPAEDVDVNVHPTKREVRLRHSWRILERLERAIAHTLLSTPTKPDATASLPGLEDLHLHDSSPSVPSTPSTQSSVEKASGVANSIPNASVQPPVWVQSAGVQLNLDGEQQEEPQEKKIQRRPISSSPLHQTTLVSEGEVPTAPPLSSRERELHRYSGRSPSSSPIDEPSPQQPINHMATMEPLAQFAESYILVQSDQDLLLIDQHALHERIRYERIRYMDQDWEQQHRIIPQSLSLTARQQEYLEANIEQLGELGFEFSTEENAWCIVAYPMVIDGKDIESFIHDVLNDLAEDSTSIPTIDSLKDQIAFMQACRGAVKANQELSLAEMKRLLEDMRHIPNPWACVHGRPTSLKLSVDALDHHFGRHG